ncbi:MAG: serine/threonine protein kinase [Hyphomicrobium sp.]|jgi:serine/threonine protein kinase|nr:serine/threonine protein kinase [Hyphomicrobium sp.]
MNNLIALKPGTELVGDFRVSRVLGAGGFGITYLADELALGRAVTIKEYFPADFAVRDAAFEAVPRSENCAGDYTWGLDRFIEEAQTLARFNHPNIVRVYRYFRANQTAYMVLHFEEGHSLKGWLKSLGRAPRQKELDRIIGPLLLALEEIHKADFLHRDIAPDNIIIRKDGQPVLIDFGSARGEIAAHSKTVSALVKPGYSPYEQYAETGKRQGPWTDIYALGATLYHAVTGKRPPDAPSRMVKDDFVSAREAAIGAYRANFLNAIDKALALKIEDRPQTITAWRGELLAPDPKPASWLQRKLSNDEKPAPPNAKAKAASAPIPDAPAPQGALLDFVDNLKEGKGKAQAPPAKPRTRPPAAAAAAAPAGQAENPPASTRKLISEEPAKVPRVLQRKQDADPKPAETVAKAVAKVSTPRVYRAPTPRRIASTTWAWTPTLFKLLIGIGVATGAVAIQDRLPQMETRGAALTSSTTTGSIDRPQVVIPAPVARLTGHAGPVTALAYSDDGATIISAGKDATVRVWSAASGALKRTIELDDGPASAIAVSAGRLLTGHANGNIVLWDWDRAEKLSNFKRNDAEIWAVAFLGSNQRFAAAGHDWKIAVWDAATPSGPFAVLDAHESAVQSLAFGMSGSKPLLASGSADKTLKVWNLETLDPVRTYRGHRDYVTAVAMSAGGREIASASLDGKVRIWSSRSNRLTRSLSGHEGRATAVVFAPAGDVLASAGSDGKIRVWDYRKSRTPRTLPSHAGDVAALAFSPDGQHIASAGDDGLVRVWNNPLQRPVTN